MSARPPYGSLALLSASALAYEVLLMRLFSIIQWHHFAYLVIALALVITSYSIHYTKLYEGSGGPSGRSVPRSAVS